MGSEGRRAFVELAEIQHFRLKTKNSEAGLRIEFVGIAIQSVEDNPGVLVDRTIWTERVQKLAGLGVDTLQPWLVLIDNAQQLRRKLLFVRSAGIRRFGPVAPTPPTTNSSQEKLELCRIS